jgi:hypothetical protein
MGKTVHLISAFWLRRRTLIRAVGSSPVRASQCSPGQLQPELGLDAWACDWSGARRLSAFELYFADQSVSLKEVLDQPQGTITVALEAIAGTTSPVLN